MVSLRQFGSILALVAGVYGAGAATGAQAQESSNRVAAETDWSVFVEESPKECWTVSAPRETVNTRDGQPVQVRRGDILLFATYRPGREAPEISFTGGYPFAGDSTVGLTIGSNEFQLFVDGQWAWAGSPEDDQRIFAAMRAGADAVLTARSARGTNTSDTFSLFGFTAASQEAARQCAD
ncbi:invasion associated locus B family protein [Roseinatronobacter monicus]|uniref:invasion associated locus B family protein n=1 Tax=Roseinatronobacter monicus TaxID=393481 RepID=UPI003F2AD996